jgi:hypothetical protein
MSLFGWALVFIGLSILALVAVGLLGLRLWRQVKAVAKDAAAASERLSSIGRPGVGSRNPMLDRDI